MEKSEVKAMVDALSAYVAQEAEKIKAAIDSIEQDAPPPAPIYGTFKVTADKALARFIYGYNEAGRPIFQIYPGDSQLVGRVKYFEGHTIPVIPIPVRADGGGLFYKIAEVVIENVDLYLRASDGVVSL